ncbi:MAG: zf-HC2 domain-containing protein [Bacteroidaceae bacterium]|nr:zf-HC2 domain-containing protein [Bacteroidaceae bacterium]
MDCKEFKNIVCDLFDKEVDPQVKAQCDEHLSHCAECSEYYDQMLATTELLRPKHSPVPDRAGTYDKTVNSKLSNSKYVWLRIAAVFAGIVLLSGIALATVLILKPQSHKVQSSIADNQWSTANDLPADSVRFDGVRLDSILTVVSAHYDKAVFFRSDETRDMTFLLTWEPDKPLADFIAGMNMFDGLQLTLQSDTIFVEAIEEEDAL